MPNEDIRDIKPIIDVPITWMEILKRLKGLLIRISLGLLAIAILIISWLYFRKKFRGDQAPIEVIIPTVAPEVTALAELHKLKESKSWLEKTMKPYFSDLTNILRVYIEGIFHINAMEMTTDEILSCFDRIHINEESKTKLTYLLKLADGVKFAKQKPLVNECEICLDNAFDFVNDTKPTEAVQQETEKDDQT
ncbi:MAG: hypothetical protein IH948_10195 [Bacteroidetes bacterium]|nr:hypothetical protein [Bacteroidota bacterium]